MIGFRAYPASRQQNKSTSLYGKFGKERYRANLFILLSFALSCLFLFPICAAQGGYEIRNAIVTPEYGYEDFTYSAEVWSSEEAASKMGASSRHQVQPEN